MFGSRSELPWFTIALTTLVLGSPAWGFWHGGYAVGADLLKQWVLYTAGLAAAGLRTGGRTPAEHPGRRHRRAAQAVPPRHSLGHVQRAGRSTHTQTGLQRFPGAARRCADPARLVSQPRVARGIELHPDQPGHRHQRMDRRGADLRQVGRLIVGRASTRLFAVATSERRVKARPAAC